MSVAVHSSYPLSIINELIIILAVGVKQDHSRRSYLSTTQVCNEYLWWDMDVNKGRGRGGESSSVHHGKFLRCL